MEKALPFIPTQLRNEIEHQVFVSVSIYRRFKEKRPNNFFSRHGTKDTNFLGIKGRFHKLMQVGGWLGSKILRVYVSTLMEHCFIGKIKFIEHVLVRHEIKNPVTKLNVSRFITRFQFVTYAEFVRILTNTLSESMQRDGGHGRQSSPYFLHQLRCTNTQSPSLLTFWNSVVLFKMINNPFNLHFQDVFVIFDIKKFLNAHIDGQKDNYT